MTGRDDQLRDHYLRDISNELSNINNTLGKLEERTLGMQATLTTSVLRMDERDEDHEGRLRKVEHRQYWFAGVAAAIAATFGVVAEKFGLHPH